jgi:5-methylthioadenosine/S-adenosylhomocysteine deaminase
VTTIIRAAWVLAQTGQADVQDGAIAVVEDLIAAVGPFDEIRMQFPEAAVLGDGTGVLLPGLVNAHTHLSEGLLSGMGEEWTLFEWGTRTVGATGQHMTAEMAEVGALLKLIEMARSGVTCVNDMFWHINAGSMASLGAARAVDHIGLRATLSFGPESFDPTSENERVLALFADEQRALSDFVAGRPLLTQFVGLGTIGGSSDALLGSTAELARELGLSVHTHLAEVREEITDSRLRHGCTTLERVIRHGALPPGSIAAHSIWVTEAEMDELHHRSIGVVHNPVANMILADGVCPVPSLRRRGVPVGLGTDGACSNDAQDALQAMKMASLLQKVSRNDPRVMTARDALAMATIEGARVLGLDHLIGSLEVGKQADLVLLQGDGLSYVHDPAQAVVYAAGVRDVELTMVAGRVVTQRGQVAGDPGHELRLAARRLADVLAGTADLPSVYRHQEA